jgi:hypothetical protein
MPYTTFFMLQIVKGIICFWSSIRWCVLSLINTWKCQYGIPSVKRPLINCSTLKLTCKCIFRWFSACLAVTLCSFRLRYSTKGTIVKKMPILNKNIVHLVDDMFWNMGFKTEKQTEMVISVILIILIIRIILIISYYRCIILIIRIILIKSIIHIILIISFSGAYGTRYRGSHLAGQTRSHCPDCWWVGW